MTEPNPEDLRRMDAAHYLHPFTDFHTLQQRGSRLVVAAHGPWIIDEHGREILDGMSGLWCCGLGYGREEIARAVYEQLQTLPYYNSFFQCAHPPAIELAARLAALAPAHINHAFFTSSGSEAIDTALRMVRRYWDLAGCPEKRQVISRHNAYHGSTIAGASLGGMAFMHAQFERLSYVSHVDQPYWFGSDRQHSPEDFGRQAAAALEREILRLGADKVAAFIAEPIQGAGGVIIPPDTYWPEVSRICRQYDVLLISDEVICGFGRLGAWFGCEFYGTRPDLITFAKAVTNGYQPLGGVLVGDRIADVLTCEGGEFAHGYTYSGHPAACAAALATLTILEREQVLPQVCERSAVLQGAWQALADHPLVGEVRGVGFFGAIELVADRASGTRFPATTAAGTVCREASLECGLVMRAVGDTMIIAPPLILSEDEIALLGERARAALDLAAQRLS